MVTRDRNTMVTVMTDKSQSSKITNANTWQWIVDSQKHTVCAHIYQGLVNVKTPLILPGEIAKPGLAFGNADGLR